VKPLAVSAYTLVTALGSGRAATLAALEGSRSGLARRDFETAALGSFTGIVDAAGHAVLPPALARWDCRNQRLAELGLGADGFADRVAETAARCGPRRVGVFMGTSTSGILQTELAYRERDAAGALPPWLHYETTHDTASLARYVQARLGLAGPAFTVSTACSSSAKVFADAARFIAAGLIDAAVVGGVDSLCLTTLYGFRSLELVSHDVCRPWDAERAGLSLGEGAAFALLEAAPRTMHALLLGTGESSDGHHMSAPHPEGAGAVLAMRAALADAGVEPQRIDYLNLHGTATPGNDAAEDRAVSAVFGPGVACSSTKGFTGHTLGAAGAVEAAITMLALEHGLLPATLHLRQRDPALVLEPLRAPQRRRIEVAASNSFGFGGSNASLVFGAAR
jgi:3-oxoacyl-[acyl-carrier-protein] synthase-1